MPQEISIDEKNGIILVRSWGQVSIIDMISSRDEIFRIYSRTGIDKVLVDGRQQHSFLKVVDSYQFTEEIGRDSRSRKIRYAVVPSGLTMEDLCFLETTSKTGV